MTLILLYIMFLVIMLLVYSKYVFDIVMIGLKFMYRIIEHLTQYSSELGSRIVCKCGAYTLFCLWMHPTCRNVW
jgi:hypothetical protein